MFVDVGMNMRIDMCVKVWMHACRHAYRHAYRHVCKHVCKDVYRHANRHVLSTAAVPGFIAHLITDMHVCCRECSRVHRQHR